MILLYYYLLLHSLLIHQLWKLKSVTCRSPHLTIKIKNQKYWKQYLILIWLLTMIKIHALFEQKCTECHVLFITLILLAPWCSNCYYLMWILIVRSVCLLQGGRYSCSIIYSPEDPNVRPWISLCLEKPASILPHGH